MIFDQPPAELPVATLRPREPSTRIAVAVRSWVAARWQWFRPRTVPVIVAFAGMLAVLGSASYLRNFARQPPERLVVVAPVRDHVAVIPVEVVTAPAPAIVVIDGELDAEPAPSGADTVRCVW